MISIIAAMAKNRVIGHNNTLPWHLPADMQHFMRTTLHKPVIMGRLTFESMQKNPLRDRRNIVLTQQMHYEANDVEIAHSLKAAIALCDAQEEIMIIGGARLYEAALPLADRIYLTEIDAAIAGDTYFPHIDPTAWASTSETTHIANEKNAYTCCFRVLERESGANFHLSLD